MKPGKNTKRAIVRHAEFGLYLYPMPRGKTYPYANARQIQRQIVRHARKFLMSYVPPAAE